MTSTPQPATRARPWALAGLWVLLTLVLGLLARQLQPHLPAPADVVPLAVAAPALAALVCFVAVRKWFPEPEEPVDLIDLFTPLQATAVTALVFVLPFWLLLGQSGTVRADAGMTLAGLALSSVALEIGFRGVLYRALEAVLPPLPAAVGTGLVFGVAQITQLRPDGWTAALVVVSAVLLGIATVALWTGSWTQRVVIASFFQFLTSVSVVFLGGTDARSLRVCALAASLAAVVAVVLGRALRLGDLSRDRS